MPVARSCDVLLFGLTPLHSDVVAKAAKPPARTLIDGSVVTVTVPPAYGRVFEAAVPATPSKSTQATSPAAAGEAQR
jgi:hypothetical protein